jgi:hypothetical protein
MQPVLETALRPAQPVLDIAAPTSQPVVEPLVQAVTQISAPIVETVGQTIRPIVEPVAETAQAVVQPVLAEVAQQPILRSTPQAPLPPIQSVRQPARPVIETATSSLRLVLRTLAQVAPPVTSPAMQIDGSLAEAPGATAQRLVSLTEPPLQATTGIPQPQELTGVVTELGAASSVAAATSGLGAETAAPLGRNAAPAADRAPAGGNLRVVQGPGRASAGPTQPPAMSPASDTPPTRAAPSVPRLDDGAALPTLAEQAAGSVTVPAAGPREAAITTGSFLDMIFDLPLATAADLIARVWIAVATGPSSVTAAGDPVGSGLQLASAEEPAPLPVLFPGDAGSSPAFQFQVFATGGRASPPPTHELGSRLALAPNLLRSPLLAFPLERPG